MGAAIADAVSLPRKGLSRRAGLARYGRPKLRYRKLPRFGGYGSHTQLMLIGAQAILNSRSDARCFRRAFQSRLGWYLFSLPVGTSVPTLLAAAKCWFSRVNLPSGVNSAGSEPASRAMFCALALNGTGNRATKWVEDSTRLTHKHPLAIDGCKILSQLAATAATTPSDKLNRLGAIEELLAISTEPDYCNRLKSLPAFLEAGRSPSFVARHFGWERGIGDFIVPVAVMATYCWLRYPENYHRAVVSAMRLGGDTHAISTVVGGLVGAHIGAGAIPPELSKGLGGYPHGPAWMSDLAERFSHWPHGPDDLHIAPGQPSDPIMQVTRNLFLVIPTLLHCILRGICSALRCCR